MNFYLKAFCTFFKIGLFTIGGGYAMVPLIEEEVVNRKHWISQEEFIDLLAVSQSVPGVFAVNFSIYGTFKIYYLFRGTLYRIRIYRQTI